MATFDGLEKTKELALDNLKYRDFIDLLKSQGGLGFLLSVSDYPLFKSKKRF